MRPETAPRRHRLLAISMAAFVALITTGTPALADDNAPAGDSGTTVNTVAVPQFVGSTSTPTVNDQAEPPPLDLGDIDSSLVLLQTEWSAHAVTYGDDEAATGWSARITDWCNAYFVDGTGFIVAGDDCADTTQYLPNLEASLTSTYTGGNETKGGPQSDINDDADLSQRPRLHSDDVGLTVTLVRPGAIEDHRATVRFLERDGQHALFKVDSLGWTPQPLPLATSLPAYGDPVTTIGYRTSLLYQAFANAHTGDMTMSSKVNPFPANGEVGNWQYDYDGSVVWPVTQDITDEVHGGPALNERGEVIGLSGNSTYLTFSHITNLDSLVRLLQTNGVQYATLPPPATDIPVDPAAETSDTGLGLLDAVAIVILAIVASAFTTLVMMHFLRRNQKTSGPVNPTPASTGVTSQGATGTIVQDPPDASGQYRY